MPRETTILSLNPDRSMVTPEEVFRANGSDIISVATPMQARFEIEMGRCGVFLWGPITPVAIGNDLARLFRRNCPDGLVIFVGRSSQDPLLEADIKLPELSDVKPIMERIRGSFRQKMAS